jgi:hypothetical protein
LDQVVRERWDRKRTLLVAVGLASFYATYVSYRNLKGALPFARDVLHDEALLDLDRAMAFGHDPATLLHSLLGTGVAAHVLSAAYLLFLAFVPLSLGAALVWARSERTGAFYVTALGLNWLMGAATYYLVPSLGARSSRAGAVRDLPGDRRHRAAAQPARDPRRGARRPAPPRHSPGHRRLRLAARLDRASPGALVAHRLGLHRVVRWRCGCSSC